MKLKTNLVLFVIVASLGAFVYFYEIRGGEERQKEAAKAKELLSFQQSAAKRLVIERPDTTLVLEEKDGNWVLTAPVEDMTDEQAVERYLRNVQETERERVVVDSADAVGDAELAGRYGLDEPRLKVLLETEDGALDTVVFGKDTPTERFAYVQQRGSNPEVFVVRAWRFDNLDKSVFDLRDTRVLPFDKDEVVELKLMGADQRIVAVKEGEDWQLEEPVSAAADAKEIDGLLNHLKNAKAAAFVAEQADEEALAEYGLAPLTTLEVSLLVGDDRAEKRLRIGAETDEGGYYARDLSSPQVFRVDSSLVNQLRKEVGDLRDKKPLKFARDEVTRIELQNASEPLIGAAKDTSGTWVLTFPEGRNAKSWKWNSLLTDLEQLEAAGFTDASDTGYQVAKESTLLRCTLFDGEGERLQIRFAGQADGEVYLTREGDPSVYRVDGEDFADFDLSLDDLAQLPPQTEAQEDDTAAAGD